MKRYFTLINLLLIGIIINAQTKKFSDTTLVELITFESESLYFRQGTPTTNVWQIGQPTKANFPSAHSVPNAIVTDTLNPYPTNNHSWFDLAVSLKESVFFANIGVGFYHKLQTTKNRDGGYITVSYDCGKTFTNIINDTLCPLMFSPTNTYFPNVNLYAIKDTLFNGESGFSGEKYEWQYTEFYWVISMLTKAYYDIDSLIIRFNFISGDFTQSLDGWMIDDIHLFYNHDMGSVHSNPLQSNIEIFPNPIENTAQLQTKNQQVIERVEIYTLKGELIRSSEVNSSTVVFNRGLLPAGTYVLTCRLKNNESETLKIIIR